MFSLQTSSRKKNLNLNNLFYEFLCTHIRQNGLISQSLLLIAIY